MGFRFTRPFTSRYIKVSILVIALMNVFVFTMLLSKRDQVRRKSFFHHTPYKPPSSSSSAYLPKSKTSSSNSNFIPKTTGKNDNHLLEDIGASHKLYDVPTGMEYTDLNTENKIKFKLNEVATNNEKYWLAHTQLTDYQLEISPDDFLQNKWIDNPALFYDPRFTLSVYIDEIKRQSQVQNQQPQEDQHSIVLPFHWSDWVDLTMLNEELTKSDESHRKNCQYMKAVHHIPARDPNYCLNNEDITQQDLAEMQLPSTKFIPGFSIKKSPANKASNEVRMLEGKSHLLTYAANPLNLIFLNKNGGVYEVKLSETKQRIVDGEMYNNFLQSHNVEQQSKLTLDPVEEFNDLLKSVKPKVIVHEEDIYGMLTAMNPTNPSVSRELHIPETAFQYGFEDVNQQIEAYEKRLNKLFDLTSNELIFDLEEIEKLKLSRKEKIYYDGLKYSTNFVPKKEETYFRMARLNFGNEENDHDAGWHYEWKFFNGALRYLKQDWNQQELLIRETVLLDRMLRNWFRFANEKGIVSWIAHGPLLSWYWDGLMFPFDEDIDIQMPMQELIRFSKNYNQTLIVEDVTEGFGKYLIDCSHFIHHRGKSYKENHIDARFIDIDTGSFIDITGVSTSEEKKPKKYNDIIEAFKQKQVQPQPEPENNDGKSPELSKQELNKLPIYNCRNLHFYSYDELIPLRLSMISGVPTYIPNKVIDILEDEYQVGMDSYEYDGYFYIDALHLWIHKDKLLPLFTKEETKKFTYQKDEKVKKVKGDKTYKTKALAKQINHKGDVNIEKFIKYLKNNFDDEKILKLLESDENVLLEYYLTKQVTELHHQELSYLFNVVTFNTDNFRIDQIKDQKSNSEITNNEEYHRFTSNFKFQTPLRRALFNYENIDRPRHHHIKS
ncbi:LicD family-domain-containing protein [Scheffersomyces coipomensis]|uniref:LicD family-domain-containing protein n=1 Tax=Scheffersomyces coipomensis TaxID=1788519 RepID=UPI00315CEDC7